MNCLNSIRYFLVATAVQMILICSHTLSAPIGTDSTFLLSLKAPVDKWDEAIPLGNGLNGGLLWGNDNEIRLSLDRGDLWDIREHPGFTISGFTYDTVRKLALAGLTDSLNKQYSRVSDFPTKLPGCRIVITLPENSRATSFCLDMKKGIGSVHLGDRTIECFFSAGKPVAMMKIPGAISGLRILSNMAVEKLGYSLPEIMEGQNETWLIQKAALGFSYVFLVQTRQIGDNTFLAISSATNKEAINPLELARKHANVAMDAGFENLLNDHVKWWNDFWSKSSVILPDSEIQMHYNLVQYFYGAGSREGAPPMPLQGIWTADEGKLPPWHGDYHHDLNTQLTYWAYLTSNRPEQGMSFLEFMWSLKPVHEKFAHDFFGTNGLVVPGVMSFDGKPMGAWYQYSLSPAMGAWIAQSFYWHWRYFMDEKFLRERAYPYCTGIAEALAGLMAEDSQGKLKLPLSSSPELHNNSQKAWLTPNSNFDLSLIRWIFGANAEMAKALGKREELLHWQNLLSKMDDLAVNGKDGALLVSPDEPLKESHRHFSHLMAVHPLGILSIEGSARDRKVIDASLRQIDTLGSKYWCGYSFSWMACIRARAGQGEKALENLVDYLDCTTRNGFHVNGPQTHGNLSDYKMRAFTLEGNFAAAQAVHEMLIQSWNGIIRVFPAIPEDWKDASFQQLRTEGGFLVDAERKGGKTIKVSVTATVDQLLRLKNPFGKSNFQSDRTLNGKGDELLYMMKKGETVRLVLR